MAKTQDITEANVKFRPPLGLRLLLLVGGVAVATSTGYGSPYWAAQTVGLIMVVAALWMSTFGVVLTPGTIWVLGFRRRTIPWAEIQNITPVIRYGERQVTLTTTDGTHVRLRAPSTVLAGRNTTQFGRDFHTINRYWLNHRGPNWTPKHWTTGTTQT